MKLKRNLGELNILISIEMCISINFNPHFCELHLVFGTGLTNEKHTVYCIGKVMCSCLFL